MLQCTTCSQTLADCFHFFSDSYSHYLPAIFWPSVRGLHQGTFTACFKAQHTNHSSSIHPLLGSSHFVPSPSLHTRARPLRTKMTCLTLLKWPYGMFSRDTHHTKISRWHGERGALPFFLQFPPLKYLREAIKNSFVKVLNFGNDRINVSFVIQISPFLFTLDASWCPTRLDLVPCGSQGS